MLEVQVARAPASTELRINEVATKTDASGEAKISIPRAQLGTAGNVRIVVDPAGANTSRDVAVPSLPSFLRVAPPSQTSQPGYAKLRHDFAVEVEGDVGGRAIRYDWVSEMTADGTAVVRLPCGITAGRVDGGTVRTSGAGPELVVPIRDALRGFESLANETAKTLSIDAEVASGGRTTITVKGRVRARDLMAAYRDVARTPFPWSPARKPGSPAPVIVFLPDGAVDETLLGGAKLGDVSVVAITSTTRVDVGGCGPYGDGMFGEKDATTFIRKLRTDAKVEVFEVATGKSIATKTLPGASPACPSVISIQNGTPLNAIGALPKPAILTWVKKASAS